MSSYLKPDLFASIYQHATIGILASNARGKIIMANAYAVKTFGYSSEEDLMELSIEDLIPKRFHKKHVRNRKGYQKNATTRAMGAGRDLYGLRKDGSEFPVEVSLSPYKKGNEAYVFAFIIDITVRKQIEASEKNYQKKITDILASLRKEKELNDMKSNFISMASHEFKTPLTTILSSASLLSKYTETSQQDRRNKHIDRIKSAVHNLNGILSDFLSITRIEEGKINLREREFNLKEHITTLQEEFSYLLKRDQKLSYTHEGDEIIFLDPDLMRNVLSNLLTNAIKFSDAGKTICIRSSCEEHQILISVKDQGIGISQKDLSSIFERFYRSENVVNTPGTGLGLFIVNNYVELMRGKVEMNSELGKGTEIILTFER